MYKASIKIPSDFSNVSELCNYVQLMYNVRIAPKPNTLDEVVIRTNEGSELEGAQNLALLFIGPESNKVLNLHPDIRELFVLPTIRRYLARGFTLIITVTGDSSLSVRGSRIVVEFFSKALNSVNPSKITSFKNGDLINLCGLHGIDTSQLVNTSKKTRFVLYNFVMELESLVNSYGSSLQDPKNLNQISEPEFVEVFRNSKSTFLLKFNQ